MADRNFNALIAHQAEQGRFLCVGIDPDIEQIPIHMHGRDICETLVNFCVPIVEATAPFAAAFKPNYTFFERFGEVGLRALRRIIAEILESEPDIPVILDRKGNEIGASAEGTATMAFTEMRADGLTINPSFGYEANKPFLQRRDKTCFVLCRTSNPGSDEFQELIVRVPDDEWIQITQERRELDPNFDLPRELPFYQYVAYRAALRRTWNAQGNSALVVGATYPDQMEEVRRIVGDMLILAPGVGKQGAKVEDIVPKAKNSLGCGFLINVSSPICHALIGVHFATAAGAKAAEYDAAIKQLL